MAKRDTWRQNLERETTSDARTKKFMHSVKLPNFDVKFQKYLKTNRGDEIGPKNDVWYKASVEILILS